MGGVRKTDCRTLAKLINKRLRDGVKTNTDKNECLKLDETLSAFVEEASEEEVIEFRKFCYGLEVFVMIVEGLKYDTDKEKYEAEFSFGG